MSIRRRGDRFHYRFYINNNDYNGVCEGAIIPKDATPEQVEAIRQRAVLYEEAVRAEKRRELQVLAEKDKEIRMNKSVIALVENYKFELTGGGRITFREAFALAAAKPSRRKASSTYAALRETYWNDFTAFMEATYPDIRELSAVRKTHCEAYVSYLIDNGRYDPRVHYIAPPAGRRKRDKAVTYTREYKISAKTIKEITNVCSWVFNRLSEDAGIFRNPWEGIVLPEEDATPREIFTRDEILLIWNGMQDDPFIYHLFMVAANSGMTEGDICTLKWENVDWTAPGGGAIRGNRRKTGARYELPMIPQLREYLAMLPRNNEYISPRHAEMYLHQQSCVSSRVINFLQGLGIKTTVKVDGRRAQSVKDLHSMRHVFCYRAKRAGIPDTVIQKFVGHRVVEMTQHYADHDTMEDLALEIRKLPLLFAGELDSETRNPRKELADLAYSLPLEQVKELLAMAGVRATA